MKPGMSSFGRVVLVGLRTLDKVLAVTRKAPGYVHGMGKLTRAYQNDGVVAGFACVLHSRLRLGAGTVVPIYC